MLTVIFLAVAAVMATIGEGVARTFARFESLQAYKFDLIGSLLGIVAISALAFLGAPPLAWGGVGAAVFAVLLLDDSVSHAGWLRTLQVLSLLGIVALPAIETFTAGFSWSPYYKIEVKRPAALHGGTAVSVNGVPHQANYRPKDNPIYNLVYGHIADPRL